MGGLLSRIFGGDKGKGPVMKQIRKMISAIEKHKDFDEIEVKSRQELITEQFLGKLQKLDLTLSEASGYVPASYVPFALLLKKLDVPENITEALLQGIEEAESEESVRGMIGAALEAADIDLEDEELHEAEDLGLEEWRKVQGRNEQEE
ncbi:hypothetical protein EU538_11585 [Candidatus Thorarchaeota archaeon]|nr:MAG: hypothetical protein EU538_11585 [Candidatus Thorarchaeota archaeon]